jgi:ankyrin repeat protein
MSVFRLPSLRIFIFGTFLCHSACLVSQKVEGETTPAGEPVIDTSDYIPSFYPKAADYNLMIAASRGYASEIERLIGEGADVNAESDEGATPLVFAVTNNMVEAVKVVLKYNPIVDKVTSSLETPLLIAVKNNNSEITEALIRGGADVDFTGRHGASALHYASINGYLELTDLLLYYNAFIDAKSDEGTTPLLASIVAGFADVADLLIQKGANMEAMDNEGFTPFLMASFYGDTLIMDMLFRNGVDIYATNKSMYNALGLSILGDQPEVTKYLLRIGDRWTNSVENALSPYAVASKYRRKDMISILNDNRVPGRIKYGIDQVAITVSSRFATKDIYTGFSLSFKEPYLNGGIIAGCDIKLWYTRVLVKDSEHLFYQYMNKGSVAYAGLFKDFVIFDNPVKSNLSLSISLLAGYSFGNMLKGTLVKPDNQFMVIPDITFKWNKRNFSLSAGLEYMNSQFYNVGPLWIRVGCSYSLFFDKDRIQVKTIKWY